jgi:hypothetical protein
MPTYILVTLIFLGWAFFELSGGREFDPEAAVAARMAERQESDAALSARIAAAPPAERPEPRTSPVAETIPQRVATVADATPEPAQTQPAETTLAALPTEAAAAPQDPAPETDTETDANVLVQDLRLVRPSRANMREGPGTNNPVLATLDRGTEVEVLGDPSGGWVQLRVIETNLIGWMAQSLLIQPDN